MKNICFLNTVEFWGGGEKLHFDYAKSLKDRGYNVYLACHASSQLQKKIVDILPSFSFSAGNLSFLNPFKIIKLARCFKKHNIDTLIFSTSHDFKIGSIAAKISGVKKVVYLRGLAAPIKANWTNRILLKYCVTHFIANSKATSDMALSAINQPWLTNKTTVIYHGIRLEDYQINRQTQTRFTIGIAGRLTPQKGHKHLIEVAKILKQKELDFEIRIAGTGPLEEELKTLAFNHDLSSNIVFEGFTNNISSFLNRIDLFVLTSEWEGFGYVIAEAMVFELPVVAFEISSNPELIENNKTGILTEFRSTQKMAEAICNFYHNPELLKSMGSAGRKRLENNFLFEDKVKNIIDAIG